MNEFPNEFFGNHLGFAEHRDLAIRLFGETLDLLDRYSINHMLISGTLLGYVRHGDIIPWDDDIDILVDSSIINELPVICKDTSLSIIHCGGYIKTCSRDGVYPLKPEPYFKSYSGGYFWPFIDMFIYHETDRYIHFFERAWDKRAFLPAQPVDFLGLRVGIPTIPEHFLTINYGSKYMTTFQSSMYNHKKEEKRDCHLIMEKNDPYSIK